MMVLLLINLVKKDMVQQLIVLELLWIFGEQSIASRIGILWLFGF
jgi:hypothetical protein